MTQFLVNLGFSKTQAGDLSLFLWMFLAGVALIFVVKKSKLGAYAFSVYIAYFVTQLLYFDFFKTYTVKIFTFLTLSLIVHYALLKSVVVIKLSKGNAVRWVKRIAISLAIVGFMVTIILNWMPDREVVKMLSPITLKLFTTKFAKLLWALAPLVVIAVVRKKED